MKKITKIIMIIIFTLFATSCGNKSSQKEIVLLRGQYSEIDILMEMTGILISDNTDLKVKFHDSMNPVAGSDAVERKEINLYVHYDGVMLSNILNQDPSKAPKDQDFFEYVKAKGIKERNLTLFDKIGFENTYKVAVRKDTAKKYNLKKTSDLKKYASKLRFGAEHSFYDDDGTIKFKPFNKFYGLHWKDNKSIDIALKYAAIENGTLDVTVSYSTDGLNLKYGLVLLEDDKKFFPDYNATLFFNKDLFNDYKDSAPNLKETLAKLTGKINAKQMTKLNYEVDVKGRKPYDVAKEFLDENNIK